MGMRSSLNLHVTKNSKNAQMCKILGIWACRVIQRAQVCTKIFHPAKFLEMTKFHHLCLVFVAIKCEGSKSNPLKNAKVLIRVLWHQGRETLTRWLLLDWNQLTFFWHNWLSARDTSLLHMCLLPLATCLLSSAVSVQNSNKKPPPQYFCSS